MSRADDNNTRLWKRGNIDGAIQHLRAARDRLHEAGANRAADKVRAALKSAEGAARHADRIGVDASILHYQPKE